MKYITDKAVEDSLELLAKTDESYAKLKARVKALEYQGKTIKAQAFLIATGTVAEREANAYTSQEYTHWLEDYENAMADAGIQEAKRKRAELTIELWRTESANKRKGNL